MHRYDLSHIPRELGVPRLDKIHKHLWLAGTADAHPLHQQKMKQREFVITERTDLHLVWWGNHMFVKPVPRFLLNHKFFQDNLCSNDPEVDPTTTMHANACGLLLSYIQLVKYESDFKIAIDLGLLPKETKWGKWLVFAQEIDSHFTTNQMVLINRRYMYGGLHRVSLNWIYRFTCNKWIDGYWSGQYGNFSERYFAWLLTVFAYVSVILSAMQVGLATQQGGGAGYFDRASYGITLALLIGTAGSVAIIGISVILPVLRILRSLARRNSKHHQAPAARWLP